MVGAPLSNTCVDVDERRVRSHQVGEKPQEQPADEHHAESDRQRQACPRPRVETPLDVQEPAVTTQRVTDTLRCSDGGARSRGVR